MDRELRTAIGSSVWSTRKRLLSPPPPFSFPPFFLERTSSLNETSWLRGTFIAKFTRLRTTNEKRVASYAFIKSLIIPLSVAASRIRYEITSGNIGGAFAVKNMTGAIYVAGALDYETRKRVGISL